MFFTFKAHSLKYFYLGSKNSKANGFPDFNVDHGREQENLNGEGS